MNQPQLFNFNGQRVRTVIIDNEPYFVGKDVATILGYKNPSVAVSKNVSDKYKGVTEMETPGGKQKLVIISEAGLYKLAFKSHVPQAERFTDWIADEVLPSIRKTGSYSIQRKPDSYMIDDPVKRAERWIEERKAYEALVPKGQYFDSQMRNPGTMTVTEIAKDYGMSAREFNQLLHKYGIQFKQGKHWVLYHKYDGKGYTQYEPFAYNDNKGVHNNLKWTQRGRKFIYDTLKEHGILPVLEQPELLPEVNAVD